MNRLVGALVLTAALSLGSAFAADKEEAHRFDHGPEFSPDGKQVVFSSNRDGDYSLYVVGAGGGSVKRLTPGDATDGEAAWFPNGESLVFTRKIGDLWSLCQIKASGGEVDQLQKNRRALSPTVSPDGMWIAFEGREGENNDLYMISTKDKTESRLTVDDANDFGPSWSPDGKRIVFSSNRTGNYDLWILTLEDRSLEQITNDPGHETKPAWSPDGGRILYASIDGDEQVLKILTLGKKGSKTLVENSKRDPDCDWSPTGDAVVYVVSLKGGTAIATAKADGTGEKIISGKP